MRRKEEEARKWEKLAPALLMFFACAMLAHYLI